MAEINPHRVTHAYTGDELVVFLIGMRINKPWRVRQWWPVFTAMPPMLKELSTDPHSGLLGYRMTVGAGGPTIIQYWSSTHKLYAYASDPHAKHRPAWAEFNKLARKAPATVGIWHETYVVARAESIYVGMPPSRPCQSHLHRARDGPLRQGPRPIDRQGPPHLYAPGAICLEEVCRSPLVRLDHLSERSRDQWRTRHSRRNAPHPMT